MPWQWYFWERDCIHEWRRERGERKKVLKNSVRQVVGTSFRREELVERDWQRLGGGEVQGKASTLVLYKSLRFLRI